MHFADKDRARSHVWDTLQDEGVARFPFPPHGRIPNFQGAREAADLLLDHPMLEDAEVVKVNPDAPQRFVRAGLLEAGVTVLVPTPRLRGGFQRLDPANIPQDERGRAASLSHMDTWAEETPLDDLPAIDLVVTGSVAVTRGGRRVGKGEGYSDLEYAILRELGQEDLMVATTIHPLQVVDQVPRDPTDLPLHLVVTPEAVLEVEDPPPPPEGIDWSLLTEEDLEAMPVLRELPSAPS